MYPEVTFAQLALLGAGLGIVYAVILACYRILFHPLNKYPGPVAAKTFDLYGAFYAFNTSLHKRTLQAHAKFGPVVRHGPNKLVFNSVGALRDIYQNKRLTKARAYLVSQNRPGVYGLFHAIDPLLHQRKRKLVGRFLAPRSYQTFETVLIGQIDIFIQQLRKHSHDATNKGINMTDQTKYLFVDIMGHFLFKHALNLQTEATNRTLSYTRAKFLLNVGLQLPSFLSLRIWMLHSLWSMISRKRCPGTVHKIILNYLSQGQQVKQELRFMSVSSTIPEDDEEWVRDVQTEAIWHLIAGSDTTSATLSALFYYLSRKPSCYSRLCEEIRSKFPEEEDIRSGLQLARCTYLRACIDETLRMSPAIPGTLWREEVPSSTASTKPLVIDGHTIPQGVCVGVNTYCILHNEEYFPDPFTFKPERWLEDSGSGQADREAFAPFSLGARGCPGKSLAYLEISLVMAKSLWHFDFELSQSSLSNGTVPEGRGAPKGVDNGDEFPMQDMFTAVHDGPYLKFCEIRN